MATQHGLQPGGVEQVPGEAGIGDHEQVHGLHVGRQAPELGVGQPALLLVRIGAGVRGDPETETGALVQMPVAAVEDQQGILGSDLLLQADQKPEDLHLGRLIVVQLVGLVHVAAFDDEVPNLAGVPDRVGEARPL